MSAQPAMDKRSETNKKLMKIEADASADEKLKQRLREEPLTVFEQYGIPVSPEARELSKEELDRVTGGMIYDHNYVSPDVIDARGGQTSLSVLGYSVTFDLNGNITSFSRWNGWWQGR